MKSISSVEKRRIAALLLTPLMALGAMFGGRAIVSHFKTQDLIKWIGFQNDEWAQQALLEGANPNARTADGWSMVMWAVGNNGNITIVKMLIDAGAETDSTENLFVAVLEDNQSEVLSALQQGANVNAVDKDGWTPLMWAASSSPRLVKVLLHVGANAQWESKDGETASNVASDEQTERLLQDAVKRSLRR